MLYAYYNVLLILVNPVSNFRVFTSESVSDGHPDKLADQISDAVLDAILEQDPESRVACETLIKGQTVVLAGELRTNAVVDVEQIVREVIADVGYDDAATGCDPATIKVYSILGEQSRDIAQGVDETDAKEQGAGDQGMMFGYATNETDVFMPAPITYAHRLMRRQAHVRRTTLDFLRPDAKSQVTLRYEGGIPIGVDTIVISTQHVRGISSKYLEEAVQEEIIKPVIPSNWISSETKFHINPTGNFEIGGPLGDAGLTGRKIIVDTYGGMAHHGGGAFSGKDPTKVDRSAAYATRYAAKNIVAAGLAKKCEIQVSYAIGVAEPTSISVNTFGTGKVEDERIVRLVHEHFDFRPKELIDMLSLKRPIYRNTATYGHFGRTESMYTWENTDRVELITA